MSRAPFQVLAFLCRQRDGKDEILLLKRADLCVWQGVAGGGEGGETPSEAAVREICEETGVRVSDVIDLGLVEMLSVLDVVGCFRWGEDVKAIPEYAFYANVPTGIPIHLSSEHAEYRWCSLTEVFGLLEWDSNKRAVRRIEQGSRGERE